MKALGKWLFSVIVKPNPSVTKYFVAFVALSLPFCLWLGFRNNLGILGAAIILVVFCFRGFLSALYWRLLSMGPYDTADHSQVAKRNDAE
jgi:hypothetical protein